MLMALTIQNRRLRDAGLNTQIRDYAFTNMQLSKLVLNKLPLEFSGIAAANAAHRMTTGVCADFDPEARPGI